MTAEHDQQTQESKEHLDEKLLEEEIEVDFSEEGLEPEEASLEEDYVSQEEHEGLMTQHTRLRADFDNYKRRIQREQAEILSYANASLVEELLPVLDTMEMAIQAVPEGADETLKAFAEGTEKIHKQLFDILAKAGLKKIEADCAPFDPEYHEAVMMVETDEVPAQHIAEVLRTGYSFKDKVLRPTVCKVAQG